MVGRRACCASSAIPLFLSGFARKRQVCQCGATVAQLICNQWVAGSIPVTGSMSFRRSEVLYPLILPSHATNMQQLNLKVHLCVLCDRCSLSINACNEAGKAKLTVAVSIRVLGFVPPTGIGWKVTKALRAPTLLLERSRAVHGSLSCSPWVLL